MPLPGEIPWQKIVDGFTDFINVAGVDAQFTLRGEPGTVNLRVAESWRRETNPTAGIQEEVHRCRFMATTWDQAAPRAPDKGDQVTIAGGRRYAVIDAHVVAYESNRLAYVCRLSG